MDGRIERMLQPYQAQNAEQQKHALREILQEVVLCGLSRAGFFNHAAFYGGTALRIFYGLDRFSEDLDFSLIAPDPGFSLGKYLPTLEAEASSFGLSLKAETKEKTQDSAIQSAFVKAETKEHILTFFEDDAQAKEIPESELTRIKLEIDTDPADGATFERQYRLLPMPYEVRLYDEGSLFAGKIHAVLCRTWKNRVKGRDLYDYIFYLSRGTRFNLDHLNRKLIQTGFLNRDERLSEAQVRTALCGHFARIDFEQAKRDVLPFIQHREHLDIWSAEFFSQITRALECSE